MITLTHYLVLSALLFALGVYAVLTRRNGGGDPDGHRTMDRPLDLGL